MSRAAKPLDLPETRQILLAAITKAEAPVPVRVLRGLPPLSRRLAAARVKALLTEDIAASRIFLWDSPGSKAYWHRDPEVFAHDRLLSLARSEVLTGAELDQRAVAEIPPLPVKVVRAVRLKMQQEKRLCVVRLPGSAAKRFIDFWHPEAYLEIEIARLLQTFDISRPADRIRALLAESNPPVEQAAAVDQVSAIAEHIFETMNRIAFSPGTTVTFSRLRQQPELAGIPKPLFDKAALSLQQQRRALLGMHGHAASLPDQERDLLVTDGSGNFYASIYAR